MDRLKDLRCVWLKVKWAFCKEWSRLWRNIKIAQEEFPPWRGVEFELGPNGVVPMEPWPLEFFIAREFIMDNSIEIRALTFRGVIGGILKADITITKWRWIAVLIFLGILVPPPNEIPGLRHWRWAFWRTWRARLEHANLEHANDVGSFPPLPIHHNCRCVIKPGDLNEE